MVFSMLLYIWEIHFRQSFGKYVNLMLMFEISYIHIVVPLEISEIALFNFMVNY